MRWSWRVAAEGAAAGLAALALLLSAMMVPAAARAENAERGRGLYEVRCDGCHTTSVHNRAARKARDFAALRREVARWNAELGGAWTQEEIDDVTAFLNERYYGFPCPVSSCRTQSGASTGRRGG